MVIFNDKVYKLTLCCRRDILTRIIHFIIFMGLFFGTLISLKSEKNQELMKISLMFLGKILFIFGFILNSFFLFGTLFMDKECGKDQIGKEVAKKKEMKTPPLYSYLCHRNLGI
mmetsp:Transcript_5985/g.7763  ORF Transcript_5985/g.7763 Transcript_5985/m.7763 type:complete len:114 (+) Transcript_5985:1-342(+)